MVQMLHNSKHFSRPADSRRTGLADAALYVSCIKHNELYEAPGVEGEVGIMRT